MKIIGFCGSQKALSKTSHSELILMKIGSMIVEAGGSFSLKRLLNFHINSCDGCNTCLTLGKCKYTDCQDDQFDNIVNEMKEADGFVFCSPVYGEGIPGIVINFLNRFCALNVNDQSNPFNGKPLLNIVVSGGVGNASALNEFESYRKDLGFIASGYLGLGLLNSDSEMGGMTGFLSPYDSDGIMGLVNNSTSKLIKMIEMEKTV
jgi:multimeric flavodoxin WrbA